MISAKCFAVLLLAAIVKAEEGAVVQPAENARQGVPAPAPIPPYAPANPGMLPDQAHWTEQMRVAVNGANERMTQNMVVVLSSLSVTMRDAGLNNTRALAAFTRAISNGVVDLTGVVAYMPRLLALDLPNQFTEVLRLVRRNEVRVPSSVNEAIDSILVLTRQAEESGINQRVWGPVARFLPSLFNGAHDFLQTIFTTMFNVFGAGIPDFVRSPIPARAGDESNSTVDYTTMAASAVDYTTAAPTPAAPAAAGRYYRY